VGFFLKKGRPGGIGRAEADSKRRENGRGTWEEARKKTVKTAYLWTGEDCHYARSHGLKGDEDLEERIKGGKEGSRRQNKREWIQSCESKGGGSGVRWYSRGGTMMSSDTKFN